MKRQSVTRLTVALAALAAVACTPGSEPSPSTSSPPGLGAGSPAGNSADAGASDVSSTLTAVAFVDDPAGPRILVAGIDPDERIESVWIDLLDDVGLPAAIDPDGDGVSEPSDLEVPVTDLDRQGGAFFLEVQASAGLERFVHSVVATAQDRRGKRSAPWPAELAPLPVRLAGQTCDPRGFDVCTEGFACVVRGANATCEDRDEARRERCTAAPTVAPGGSTSGTVSGTSLWDPIEGCASSARRGRSEAVVRVHVAPGTGSISIATTTGKTTFDSVVSLLDGCDSVAKVLACNDDDPAPGSRITLTDLKAGDYVVVVDSLDRRGGSFELTVTTP